jgi:hypothetical protein
MVLKRTSQLISPTPGVAQEAAKVKLHLSGQEKTHFLCNSQLC